MQGIFVGNRRPRSKKEVKEAVANGTPVTIEATSMFGNEYDGMLENAPAGRLSFVGPDPYTSRRF
jgi:hypothetical protein